MKIIREEEKPQELKINIDVTFSIKRLLRRDNIGEIQACDFGGAKRSAPRSLDDNVANYRVWNYHRFRRPGRVDARAIMKYLLGGRDAVNLQRRRWRRRRWWCSCSSILFNLPRYREMHSIAISLGVEDSAHLRTLSFPRPRHPPPLQRSLSRSSKLPKKGLGRWKGAASS